MKEQPELPWVMWAAGFMEGEGSFQIPNQHRNIKNNGGAKVSCSQKIIQPLEKLQKMFGGVIYYGADNMYRWQIGKAQDALWVMEILYPHMSVRRQNQIEAVMVKAKWNYLDRLEMEAEERDYEESW